MSEELKIYQPHTIMSAHINEHGDLEIVRKYPSNMAYCSGQTVPAKVVKEIYSASASKVIFLSKEITGKHEPSRVIEEKITF